MKVRITFVMLAAMALCGIQSVRAQEEEPRHEFSLAIGGVSSSNLFDAFESVITNTFVGSKYANTKHLGVFSAEYFYHINPLVGFGAIGAFNHHKEDIIADDVVKGAHYCNYITIMPAMKLNWLRRNNWGMYSKFAVGYTYARFSNDWKDGTDDTNTESHVNFQVSLVGIEAGSNSVRGFAELGFGEQGLILGGVRFRF